MASLDKNTFNGVDKVTAIQSSPPFSGGGPSIFGGNVVLVVDSQAGLQPSNQVLDGIRSRGMETGSGVLGEGGRTGPGIVGVAGDLFGPGRGQPPDHAMHDFGFPDLPRSWAAGVIGASNQNAGVHGRSNTGHGVEGTSARSHGVVGASQDRDAVVGDGRLTGSFSAGCLGLTCNGYGVAGWIKDRPDGTSNPDAIAVFGVGAFDLATNKFIGQAGAFLGDVWVDGDFTVYGANKSVAVKHRDGSYRKLYCVESPENWFEDFGEGQLVKGKAPVDLDPEFAALIHAKGYHVFVTPGGDSQGLYVSRQTAKSFDVREQQGGTSSLRFSYRVVGKRKDVSAARLARVAAPKRPTVPKLPESIVPAELGQIEKPARPKKKPKRRK